MKFLLIFLIAFSAHGEVSFGPVKLGAERLKINLKDFKVKTRFKGKKRFKMKSGFIAKSVQWVRTKSNVLMPRARMRVVIYDNSEHYSLTYKDSPIILGEDGKTQQTEIYIDLFSADTIKVMGERK